MSEQWVTAPGSQLYSVSRGEGPPLLMLHGWTLDHRIFNPQFEGISNNIQLIAIDRRGCGKSSGTPDLRSETEDVVRVLDALGVEQVNLLGMSQGGRVALRFAARYPDRLASLVVQSPALDGFACDETPEEAIPLRSFAQLAAANRLQELRRSWLNHSMMQVDTAQQQQLLSEILDNYTAEDLQAETESAYRWDDDVPAGLRALTVKALVMIGEHDSEARKQTASEICRLIPDCKKSVFSESGHLCNLTDSAAYNRQLEQFISQGDQVPGPDAL